MTIPCWISGTGEPNAGDVIYTDSTMTTVFSGDGVNYYKFKILTSASAWSAIVNSFGVIQGAGFTLC